MKPAPKRRAGGGFGGFGSGGVKIGGGSLTPGGAFFHGGTSEEAPGSGGGARFGVSDRSEERARAGICFHGGNGSFGSGGGGGGGGCLSLGNEWCDRGFGGGDGSLCLLISGVLAVDCSTCIDPLAGVEPRLRACCLYCLPPVSVSIFHSCALYRSRVSKKR